MPAKQANSTRWFPVPYCVGVGDSKCDGVAQCGYRCIKCGTWHDGQRTQDARLNRAADLMRWIDAYAADYRDEGKLARSRVEVMRAVHAMCGVERPA
jgi:hypothetical protein